MIVLNRQVHGSTMANQTGNDPAMFLYQPRRFKCVTELLPLQRRIGYNFDLFVWGSACTMVVKVRTAFSTLS